MKDILTYKDFAASIKFSSEDDIFFGKIIGVEDSITFEGKSVSELKKAFKVAIEDYLILCTEIGKNPLKSYKGSFNIRIQPELHKQAVYKSNELGISLNQLVEQAINGFIVKEPHYKLQKKAGTKSK